uniref:MmgE/PrpD C-terminal domain-containing protein n=1 Tax=Gibberella zeae TaxID=5518 RepID=A0A4E9EBE4_GIBZA
MQITHHIEIHERKYNYKYQSVLCLGESYRLIYNTFKPFPCDRIIHPAIDGWIQIHDKAKKKGLDMTKIANVTARTHPHVFLLTDHPEPKTGLEGKFSVYHAAAIALLYGEATPKQFTDEAVQNKTVIALREKVHVTKDDKVSDHEAFVAVEFENGEKMEVHVENCIGSYKNPLDAEYLQKKFVDHVSTQIGEKRAKKALEAFVGIANSTDVGRIAQAFEE